MKIWQIKKEALWVIGMEGASDAAGGVAALWERANARFDEIAHLAVRDEAGNLPRVWGAMSDFSRSFKPWEENFSKGLYLAGVECREDAPVPEGWTKWRIPAFEYLCAEQESEKTFSDMIAYLQEHGLPLCAAVQECTELSSGRQILFFPIRKSE